MQILLESIAKLFKVKTIVTIIVAFVFAVMAIRGNMDTSFVMTITTMVISFYFGTQHEKTDTQTTEKNNQISEKSDADS